MKIWDRMSLLIRADAHGVMDRLEDRSLLVRQHLRDAEIALEHERMRVASVEEELERLGRATRRAEARLEELDRDVDLALSREEQPLARYAVRRLLPERRLLRTMRERAGELETAREQLVTRLREREAVFDGLRARANACLADLEREEPEGVPSSAPVAEEEIDLELLRRRVARTGSRGGHDGEEVPA